MIELASLVAAAAVLNAPLAAQPLTHRTPNVQGTWVTSPWNLNFTFNHRFRIFQGDITDIIDEGALENSATFNLLLGLWSPAEVGVMYATAPVIPNGNRANEWFPYLKVAPLRAPNGSVSLLGGWNSQAESVDGVLAAQALVARRFELLGEVRGFSNALNRDEAGLALAGGLVIRLTDFLALAGDIGDFVAGPDAKAAWSAGLQVSLPFTPHTFSLQASNAAATTPQEASFGGVEIAGGEVTWGFEFTVPFSGFARWGRLSDPLEEEEVAPSGTVVESRRVVEIEIREFRFNPDTVRVPANTTVRWINRDGVAHTSTADGGAWGSPLIGPGETYTFRFRRAGTFEYHCTPHPFMRGVIIVEPR